jgi:hypothetical protein
MVTAGRPRLETDKVVLAHMNFRRVLDKENAFIAWNEFSKDLSPLSPTHLPFSEGLVVRALVNREVNSPLK